MIVWIERIDDREDRIIEWIIEGIERMNDRENEMDR